jgi:phosphoserine phosphatase RsbU/P
MHERALLSKPILATLATLLAALAAFYSGLWMYDVRQPGPRVELGFNQLHDATYNQQTHSLSVEDVIDGSPAEQAGLRPGDRITAVNGRVLDTPEAFDETWNNSRPGDQVQLTVARPGEPAPLTLHGIFRAAVRPRPPEGLRRSALQVTGSFPLPFLLVGFAVLFLRLEDRNAWLLALMFCSFIAAPDIANPHALPPAAREFSFAFRAVFAGMLCPLLYLFFARFPVRSPLDLRFPWLKWAGLALGISVVLPALQTGKPQFPEVVDRLMGNRSSEMIHFSLTYALIALGLVSLAQNSFMASVPAEARRKSRVILAGTLIGVVPIVVERVAMDFAGYRPAFWLDTALVLVVFLYPLSFAYAIVKHRVMEIPVLLRRSARYVFVQRGFIVLLFVLGVSATRLFTYALSGLLGRDSNSSLVLSVAFGVVLVWASVPIVKKGTQRIDRAFFRSAYDARVILEDLAEKTRTVNDRHELAVLLEKHIGGALCPKSFACYFEGADGRLVVECETAPPGLDTFPATMMLLPELMRRGKAWALRPGPPGAGGLTALAPIAPECLVPILGRAGGLIGLLVLGQRLSEEPYAGEDKHLLDSVAGQAGITLENIRLVEKMAERVEADRRLAREMEIAREVQARLFPQKRPVMKTLEYTGGCIPARAVGGDYYDFLELRGGRLALVLADIAGKGVSGALLMANLQANLRSQCAMAVDDLQQVLSSVNRSFCENTGDASYATLFFADYDDRSRKLRYVNCGHLPPLLLSANTSSGDQGARNVEWLRATSTVVGLFEEWQCEIAEVGLAPGDTLVLYTDGITEARSADGDEFGESRLLDTLRSNCNVSVGSLLQVVMEAVERFSGDEQLDDITLVIARCVA